LTAPLVEALTMTQPIGYSYIRFCSKKQGKGSSLYRQTQDTLAGESPESWCARNGVTLDTGLTFRDLGVSAYTGDNARQGELRAFLDAVKSGRIRPGSFLLVERVDRITRQGVDVGLDLIKEILRKGVSIVTLANGRVYGPEAVKGLMKGLLELQMYLEQAQQYSEALSARVGAAWELKRHKARNGKVLATAKMPPWLAPAGDKDDRRPVVVPEKAALVRRVYDLAVSGQGVARIVRTLTEDGTPPLTRGQAWSRTTVYRLLTNRAVLGEYQPGRGRANAWLPDGPPVEGYYPEVISPATFHKVQACMGSRKLGNAGRQSNLVNVFSGLLKDARNGKSYVAAFRVEKRGGRRHHVLMSAEKAAGANSFPFPVFERAILSCLREVDPRELLPDGDHEQDEALALSGELASLESRLADLEAELLTGDVPALARVVRALEAKKKGVASRLAEARLRVANPVGEAWGEARTLLGAIDGAADPDEARFRLRPVLRRVVESIWLLVVPRGARRLCASQVMFAGSDRCRSYLILHQPPKGNQSARTEGHWEARSLASDAVPGKLDLRIPEHARRLEQVLSTLPLEG
jgi:DNA invertase Pin-like site-specific DNA recombinase